ncbi:MAG: ATP-binding protein, partial [Desulfatirhabdiaceae bacterium]
LYAENLVKEQNKYKYRIKNAAFPIIKTLDTFIFDDGRLPDLKKETVMELATCEFIKKKQNVIAVGNCGTGNYRKCFFIERNRLICARLNCHKHDFLR